jgi:hypothetical protein
MMLGVVSRGCMISSVSPSFLLFIVRVSTSPSNFIFWSYPAIVTHKGAAADAGHYIGFVKKSVFHGAKAPSADGVAAPAPASAFDDDDEDWYKFDDDKVSDFPKEKLTTLDGGGTSLLHPFG